MNTTLERPYYSLVVILRKRNLTQTQLSEMTGIERRSLGLKIFGKRKMSFREAQRIANALEISLDDIT